MTSPSPSPNLLTQQQINDTYNAQRCPALTALLSHIEALTPMTHQPHQPKPPNPQPLVDITNTPAAQPLLTDQQLVDIAAFGDTQAGNTVGRVITRLLNHITHITRRQADLTVVVWPSPQPLPPHTDTDTDTDTGTDSDVAARAYATGYNTARESCIAAATQAATQAADNPATEDDGTIRIGPSPREDRWVKLPFLSPTATDPASSLWYCMSRPDRPRPDREVITGFRRAPTPANPTPATPDHPA